MMRFTVVLFSLLVLWGCGDRESYKPVVKFGGEVANDEIGYFTLTKVPTPLEVARGKDQKTDTVLVDTNWFFLTDLAYEEGTYSLEYNGENILLYFIPGKTLNINFDAKHPFDSRAFSAGSKYPTRFLNDRTEIINKVKDDRLFKYAEKEFLSRLDSARKSLDTLLVKFITAKPTFNEEFFKDYSLRNYYFATAQMMLYPNQRHHFNDTLKPISESYYAFKEGFNFNDALALRGPEYVLSCQLIMEHDLEEILISEAYTVQEKLEARLAWIDSVMTPGPVRDYFLASSLKNYIVFNVISERDSLIQMGMHQLGDSALQASVERELEQRKHLARGAKAPDFSAVDTLGAVHKLSDLHGKVVLIDFWASWCAPCIEALPGIEKINAKFSADEFEVLQVSIDNSKGDWLRLIKKREPSATQWFIQRTSMEGLVQAYAVSGIPRYVLIDQKGSLINASAPGPDKPALSLMIEQALAN